MNDTKMVSVDEKRKKLINKMNDTKMVSVDEKIKSPMIKPVISYPTKIACHCIF